MNRETLSPTDLAALPPDSLISRNEVQTLYRIAAGTLRNRDAAGRGPRMTRLGREVRYRKRDVEAWIEAHAATANL